jgi:hypothetical protein
MLKVAAFGWRSVTTYARSGERVVIPNAAIVDQTLRVFSAGEPGRVDSEFPVPVNVPPELVERVVVDVVADLSTVEAAQPVVVAPISFEPISGMPVPAGFVRYRVRYWVRDVHGQSTIEAEVLRRIWHGFQREGIPWPIGVSPDWTAPDTAGDDVLLFAPGERIAVPERHAHRRFKLARGELQLSPPVEILSANLAHGTRAPEYPRLPVMREAQLRRISDQLAAEIGPYAEIAVSEAAQARADVPAIIERVAGEIEDEAGQRRFRDSVTWPEQATMHPGFAFAAKRDGTGRLVSDPPTRAATYATIVALPQK